jgi:UDP-N-acetyl-D-glucosamine/UDP-N-acetyl-D-galactosamine dehydrogenase
MTFHAPSDIRIGIIGLGYVGLPLAVAFGQTLPATGYDCNALRVKQLQEGIDLTGELTAAEISRATMLVFTEAVNTLQDCNVFILAIPTPITPQQKPDFSLLEKATADIAPLLKKGDTVIFESTVFPGATEELMVPILEKGSGLRYNHDFFAGYSPERINPGDKIHTLQNIVKITSGSTPEAADFVDALYRRIISAGTHKASSIRVAEAAKAIENAQRDINIAFVNELAIIFSKLGLDTHEVLQAAGTKWNFLPFTPGLVGGHCIGVDPYYLAAKAQQAGHHPEIILAGRKLNDSMPAFVCEQVMGLLNKNSLPVKGAHVLVLGIAFKENCADVRNSGAAQLVQCLINEEMDVEVFDPVVSAEEVNAHYGFHPVKSLKTGYYDAIILAVAHGAFRQLNLENFKAPGAVVYDIKNFLDKNETDGRL